MPRCIPLRRKKRQPCIGDMDNEITLQARAIKPPLSGVDASEQFTDAASGDVIYALIETRSGETVFDDTNTERDVTHRFIIPFVDGITAETWISFNGDRFDILGVEDLEERHEYLLLRASNRGLDSNRANDA